MLPCSTQLERRSPSWSQSPQWQLCWSCPSASACGSASCTRKVSVPSPFFVFGCLIFTVTIIQVQECVKNNVLHLYNYIICHSPALHMIIGMKQSNSNGNTNNISNLVNLIKAFTYIIWVFDALQKGFITLDSVWDWKIIHNTKYCKMLKLKNG